MEALGELLAQRNAYEKSASRAARLSLATSALGEALSSHASATPALAALKAALRSGATATDAAPGATEGGSGDPLVDVALSGLPDAVHSAQGVPGLGELQGAFSYVSSTGRRAPAAGTGYVGRALAGVGAGVVLPAQRVFGSFFEGVEEFGRGVQSTARDTWASAVAAATPYPLLASALERLGAGALTAKQAVAEKASGALAYLWGSVGQPLSSGAAELPAGVVSSLPEDLKAHAEATLEKGKAVFESSEGSVRRAAAVFDAAEAAVAREDLKTAVELLEGIKGEEGQELTRSWCTSAKQRIAVDKSFALIRARTDLLVSSLY